MILRSYSLIDISLRLIGHVVHLRRIMVVRISNVCVEFYRDSTGQSLLIFLFDFVENQTLKENSKSDVNEIDDISNPKGKPES